MQDKKIKKSLIIESRLKLLSLALQHKDSDIVEVIISKVLEQNDLDKQVVDIISNIEFNMILNLFEHSINEINDYLNKKPTTIVKYEDKELKELKQQLKKLEIKFQELIEEKTEYLNDIEEFNTQYSLHVGDLIKTILNLKKEILYKKTIKNQKLKKQYKANKDICDEIKQTIVELKNTVTELEEILETLDKDDENYEEISNAYNEIKEELEKLENELILQEEKLEKTEEELIENEIFEEEYEEAKATYEQFDDEYEHIKDTQKDVIKLDEEQLKELKILYKKAAKLCHPDIVADELKEKAHEIMQSLNDAYSKKNIEQVKKILLSLENGTTFKTVSSDIEDKELLLNKIKEFEQNISDLEDEIEHIKLDDTFTTITQLDNWDEYFEELKNELIEQKANLEKEAMEVLAEKEEIEEWIQKLWDWADENKIKESTTYYLSDENNQSFGMGGWSFIFTFAKNIEELNLLIGVSNSKDVRDYYEYLSQMSNEYYYSHESWQIKNCFELYTGISKNKTQLLNSLCMDLSSKNILNICDEFFKLENITHLDLSNNEINKLPEAFGKLINLEVLVINNTKINQLPLSIINLTNLKELYLWIDNLKLTQEQKIWINRLKENGCFVESRIEISVEKENISIQSKNNSNVDEVEEWIQKLWDWADENNISNGKLSRKKEKLLAMSTIDFTGLKLKNICKEIFNLKNVTTFSLWDNDISFLPNEIVNFTNLKKLNLRGNPNLAISPNQKEWIEALRGKCSVFIDSVKYITEETLEIQIDKYSSIKTSEILEENSDYSKYIKSIENIKFEKIRKYCENLSKDNRTDDMQKYLAQNGKMYKALIYDALEQFISKLDNQTITLVDWGSNQGIASMLVLDYIKEKQLDIKVSQVILVDDDTKILSRAMAQVEALSQDNIQIIAIKNDDDNLLDKIKTNRNTIALNLFANDKIPIDVKVINDGIYEDFIMCLSHENIEFVDKIYNDFNNSTNIQDLSIRDGNIGRYQRYERIFKI